MLLSELIAGMECKTFNFGDIDIRSLEYDSRKVRAGSLFIAIKGEKSDGHDYVEVCRQQGAAGAVTEYRVASDLLQVVVTDTRAAMGVLAKKFYGCFDSITKIGITGTNGKTTTAFLIHSISSAVGRIPGMIGTIYYLGKTKTKAVRTTPESLDIFKLIDGFARDGARDVVMEVSSHALSLKRVDEIRFQIAVFTNLSQDHLDFHGNIEAYKNAKLRLFSLLSEQGTAVINADDPVSREIMSLGIKRTISYGMTKSADVSAALIDSSLAGLVIDINHGGRIHRVRSRLVGEYNRHNIAAAFATGIAMDFEKDMIQNGIENLAGVRGRLEQVAQNIFVDFAHTPGALENVLGTLKKYAAGRLIVVFGCGGDRDRDKRPKMGHIAAGLADLVILTSDNPRTEPPLSIIDAIKQGIASNNYQIIPDRREAIRYGIDTRKKTDILLIAGKGHEETQTLKDAVVPFDDAEVVREYAHP